MTCDTEEAALAYIRYCFSNAIEVSSLEEALAAESEDPYAANMSQMPQLPQPLDVVSSPLTLKEELFEERAAIIEYDGELPRKFAEFLAGWKDQA